MATFSAKNMNVDWSRPQLAVSQVMEYAWGERGPASYLGKLTGQKDPGPKAELWMGAHPKAPSRIAGRGLDQWFEEKPELLGKASLNIDPKRLPFLFKVLSAAEPLSIQLHPDQQEARELHARDPEHYPDDNHKPEIAIALEEHEALLGFEPLETLLEALNTYPELNALLNNNAVEDLKASVSRSDEEKTASLKTVFTSLFNTAESDPDLLLQSILSLRERLLKKKHPNPKEGWFLKLTRTSTSADVGLFCLFFLNYRILQPGEGVFLKADVPHAYLRGNIIECMANSDNVVRAGLTPKFVDVNTLARIVKVELKPLDVQLGEDNGLGGEVYRVPVQEFEVHHWYTGPQTLSVDFGHTLGPRFGVVLKGQVSFETGEHFESGRVFFLSDLCSTPMTLDADSELFLARPGSGSPLEVRS